MKSEKGWKPRVYTIFILSYFSLLVYSLFSWTTWIIDNTIAIVLLLILFFIDRKINISSTHLILFNIALLAHNLGSLGLYSWTWNFFAYDNFVHFFSSLVAAFIIYGLVFERLSKTKAFFRIHKKIISILVFGLVISLGVAIEILEFTGDNLFGSGEGLFLTGAGDGIDESHTPYDDTMIDFIFNILGAISGTFCFFKKKYKY